MSIFTKRKDDAEYRPSVQEIAAHLDAEGVQHPTDADLARAHAAVAESHAAKVAAAVAEASAAEQRRIDGLCRVCYTRPGLRHNVSVVVPRPTGNPAHEHIEPAYVQVCQRCQPVVEAEAVAALARREAGEGRGQRGLNAAALVAGLERNGWPKRDATYDRTPTARQARGAERVVTNRRGEPMGTVSVQSRTPRPAPFSDAELESLG